ncbi:MAG: hypothetical protein CMP63_06740 [Flavobacteriales bacterium]|nr:hypothetical protein [Flavobacteriales bacterium]|tara:strand:+ start:6724 stop:7488 length:765 start_codon:yes stop_codon:yes gene_type:complete
MRWFVFVLVLILTNCSIDELPSCEGIGFEGQICKEYQYVFGRYNGVNEYEYDLNTGFISRIITKRKNGSIEGVASYSYDDEGRLLSIVFKDSKSQLLKEKKIYYNDAGDIEAEVILGKTKTEHNYHYVGDALITEIFSVNGQIKWSDSLEYFSGTNEIYRKLRFIDKTLYQITYYEVFTNNVIEERVTNYNGITQTKKVTYYNENQEIIEELTYSKENVLLNKVAFIYFDGELDKIEKYNESGEKYEELNYQRY